MLIIVGLILIGCKKKKYRSSAGKNYILKVIPMKSFLYAFIVIVLVWTCLLFNIENYIFIVIFIVIILGVNGPFTIESSKYIIYSKL